MTDKVQKIREEVEKLFNHVKDSNFESDSGAFYYLKDLLDFIDSLQEKPCNSCQGFNDKDKCDELVFTHNCPIVKNPVSEDLEKEIINYIGFPQEVDEDISTTMVRKAARHFANWQKKQDQETIEIAEDHAMLAGMVKGKEDTVGKVRSILNKVAYRNDGLDVNGDYCEQPYVELDNEFRELLKEE